MQRVDEFKRMIYTWNCQNGAKVKLLVSLECNDLSNEEVLFICGVDMYHYRMLGLKGYIFYQN